MDKIDLRSKETYRNIVTNYLNFSEEDQQAAVDNLAQDYGAETAEELVKTFTPNLDGYYDYLKIVDSIYPENAEVTSMVSNYDTSNFSESEVPVEVPAEAAPEVEVEVCPNCGQPVDQCQCIAASEEDLRIMNSVEEVINQLRALPPEQAQQVIAEFTASIGDQSFSEALIEIYNDDDPYGDFSHNMGILVANYYHNLSALNQAGHQDFSEDQLNDVTEYDTFKVPSDFSILKTINKITHEMMDFAENVDNTTPEMMQNVKSAVDDSATQALANQIKEMYDTLPSEDAKQIFVAKIQNYLDDPNSPATVDMSEFLPTEEDFAMLKNFDSGEPVPEAQATEAEMKPQLNTDTVQALVKKYRDYIEKGDTTAAAGMKGALIDAYGEAIAEQIIAQAEGRSFSEDKSVAEPEVPAEINPEAGLDFLNGDSDIEILDEKIDSNDNSNVKDSTFQTGSLDEFISAVDGDEFADEVAAPSTPTEVTQVNELSASPSDVEMINAQVNQGEAPIPAPLQ